MSFFPRAVKDWNARYQKPYLPLTASRPSRLGLSRLNTTCLKQVYFWQINIVELYVVIVVAIWLTSQCNSLGHQVSPILLLRKLYCCTLYTSWLHYQEIYCCFVPCQGALHALSQVRVGGTKYILHFHCLILQSIVPYLVPSLFPLVFLSSSPS